MPIHLGSTAVPKIYLGDPEVPKVFLGGTEVYAADAGGDPGTPFALPASAISAHSVSRAIDSSYTGNLIRVRRSSDNAEADIGVDASGNLDEAALLAHTGTAAGDHGYIRTIYEQSGGTGAVAFTQTTQALQRVIVQDGAVLKANGKPTAVATGTGASHQWEQMASWGQRAAADTVFTIASLTEAGGARLALTGSLNGNATSVYSGIAQKNGSSETVANASGTPSFYANNSLIGTQGSGLTRGQLWTAWAEKGLVIQRQTNMDFVSSSSWSDPKTEYAGADSVDGLYEFSEMIICDGPTAGDVSDIESNTASFYGITLA